MIKFASIGSNFIVHKVLKAIGEIEGFKYYASYSRSIDRACDLKNKFRAEMAYDNLEKMLDDSNIDLVYIASPNSLHFKQAKMCLLKGKNVICEKPFFTNTRELDELIAIAKSNKLFLFEAISIRYLKSFRLLKNLVKKIGEISTVMVNYSQYSSRFDKYRKGEVSNIFKSEFSAGALADLGIYNLHLIHGLFGKGEDYAYFSNINSYGVDIAGAGLIKYDDFVVSFTNAKDSFSKNYIIIQGQDGFIKVDGNIQEASKISLFKDGHKEVFDIENKESIYINEFEFFKKIYENKDFKECHRRLKDSKEVLEMFEILKDRGGIRDSYSYIDPTM